MNRLAALGLLSCLAGLAPALDGPQTVPWSQENVLAYAVAPSLDRFLDQLEGTIRVFDPNSAGQLRSNQLMQTIDDQKPIAAVLIPGAGMPPTPRWALVLPVSDPAPMTAFANSQAYAVHTDGQRLIIASEQSVVDDPSALLAAYDALPTSFPEGEVAFGHLDIAKAMQIYGPMANASLPMIPMLMGGDPDAAAMAPLLMGVAQTYLTMLDDIDAVDMSLRLGPSPRLLKKATTKDGSLMAGLFATPDEPRAWLQAWQRLPNDQSLIAMCACFQPDGLRTAYTRILKQLQAQPALASSFSDEVIAQTDAIFAVLGPSMAVSMSGDPEHFFQQHSVLAVKDHEAFLTAFETITTKIIDGALGKAYADMGLPMEFGVQRDFRKIDDTPVHRMRIFAEEAATNPQFEMMGMNGMLAPIEIACIDQWYMLSQEPMKLDAMVIGEGGQRGLPKAALNFGEDAHVFFDYDYGFLLGHMFSKFMGGEAPAEASARPIMMAARMDQGTVYAAIEVPLAPIRKALTGVLGPVPGDPNNPMGGNPGPGGF